MKTVAWCVLSAACAVLITVLVCRWHPHRAKRVWVTYSEKYVNMTIGRTEDYEKVDADSALYGEEQLSNMVAHDKSCMVVTHDRKHADYQVEIAVSRFVGDPANYGKATLTITGGNGDVVDSERFYQDRRSQDDIAKQPIKQAWEVLCKSGGER
jgi:hypothetical protein